MALEVTSLTREFRFKKDGTEVKLPDPNTDFSLNEVLQFYSGQYPELTTATLDGTNKKFPKEELMPSEITMKNIIE